MEKIKVKDLSLDKLSALYSILNSVCEEYAEMTDAYSLSTGDSKFENLSNEMKSLISQRQEYFSLKQKVKNIIKDKLLTDFDYDFK